MVVKAGLHHHPVDSTWKIYVRRQENYIFSLEGCDRLVYLHEVRHDLLETSLPLAASTGTWAGVGPELAGLFMINLFCM